MRTAGLAGDLTGNEVNPIIRRTQISAPGSGGVANNRARKPVPGW